MTSFLLDTHYWLWFQTGDSRELGAAARDELLGLQRSKALYLSAISFLEIARLAVAGRIDLGTSVDQFLEEAIRDGGLQLLPLSTRILIESTRLPGEIHRDPSDRMLVATAREHSMTLVTRDEDLLAYGRRGHLRVQKI